MPTKQQDRVLSSYYDVDANETELPGAKLLPKVLQDAEYKEDKSFQTADADKKSCLQFISQISTNVSRRSVLFASFFTIAHFANEVFSPYLSVYYGQLGFSAKEIGIIGSVKPFLAIFAMPIVGYIADRFSVTRYIIVSSLVLTACAHMAIFYVPKIRLNECSRDMCNNSSKTLDNEIENCVSADDEFSALKKVTPTDMYNTNDLRTVFIYLIVVNMFSQIAGAPWYPLANGCLLAALGPTKRNQYGYFKAVAGIGYSFGILIGGVALEMTTYMFIYCFSYVIKANYFVIFMMHSVLFLAAAFIGWWMADVPDVKIIKSKSTSYSVSTFTRALCKLRYGSVVIVIIWLSIVYAKMRTFDFWYINYLGGSFVMMGVGGLISKVTLTLTFLCLPTLNKKFGHVLPLILACLAISAGCICASVITNVAWMVIPLIVREVAYAVYSQAQGAFLSNAVDDQYQATLQSLMEALTYGVGGGLGSLLGGSIIEDLSPAMSYYIFASVSCIMAIFLTVVQVCLKLNERNHDDYESVEPLELQHKSNEPLNEIK